MAFPETARKAAGYQLHRLQTGKMAQDWKPLGNLSRGTTGVYEIRVWHDDAAFRVAYVAKFKGYIVVLHCWEKTAQATTKSAKATIIRRYTEVREKLL